MSWKLNPMDIVNLHRSAPATVSCHYYDSIPTAEQLLFELARQDLMEYTFSFRMTDEVCYRFLT